MAPPPPRRRPASATSTARTLTPLPPSSSPPAASSSSSSSARLLFVLLVNAIAAGVLYQRVSSGAIAIPEPVARLAADVTAGLGLAEALPAWVSASAQSRHPFRLCGLLDQASYILASSRVVFPDGVRPGALLVRRGKIAAVAPTADALQPGLVRASAALLAKLSSKSRSTASANLLLLLLRRLLPAPLPVHDYGYSAISPGVVDVHAHLNEPGREEWEGVATGTAAAAAGGVTSVVDMPLNSAPAATTAALLMDKAAAVRRAGPRVDVGFWGGLVPANAHGNDADDDASSSALAAMLAAGALGFKSFMCPSGIRDFDHVSVDDVRAAMPRLMRLGVPYFVHAELVDAVAADGSGRPAAQLPPPQADLERRRQYASYLATRPPEFEREAIGALLSALADALDTTAPKKGFRLHIAHLGDGGASAAALAAAKRSARLAPWLSVETCPHYLMFDAESVRDGDTRFKCAPPLRSRDNREALLRAVAGGGGSNRAGVIDLVSSDHSPAPAALKGLTGGAAAAADEGAAAQGDFIAAWGGINGLQYLLPATWTALKGAGAGGGGGGSSNNHNNTTITLVDLARLLSAAPASLVGLADRKGALLPGMDADVVVWDPEAAAGTSAARNRHRHGAGTSPYVDAALRGRVLATFVRGSQVFDARRPAGEEVAEAPRTCGQLILGRKR
jgi:allantoinase